MANFSLKSACMSARTTQAVTMLFHAVTNILPGREGHLPHSSQLLHGQSSQRLLRALWVREGVHISSGQPTQTRALDPHCAVKGRTILPHFSQRRSLGRNLGPQLSLDRKERADVALRPTGPCLCLCWVSCDSFELIPEASSSLSSQRTPSGDVTAHGSLMYRLNRGL